MKKRVKSLLLVLCLLVASVLTVAVASEKKSSSDTLVLYRNPVLDYAGEKMTGSLDEETDYESMNYKAQLEMINQLKNEFYVRPSTIETWKDQIYDVYGQGDDVYYYVTNIFSDYVSITNPTEFSVY